MASPPRSVIHKLPTDAARAKAREIIRGSAQGGYLQIVENWRQLPDGDVELTVRHLPAAD
jgi:hypothetical protein